MKILFLGEIKSPRSQYNFLLSYCFVVHQKILKLFLSTVVWSLLLFLPWHSSSVSRLQIPRPRQQRLFFFPEKLVQVLTMIIIINRHFSSIDHHCKPISTVIHQLFSQINTALTKGLWNKVHTKLIVLGIFTCVAMPPRTYSPYPEVSPMLKVYGPEISQQNRISIHGNSWIEKFSALWRVSFFSTVCHLSSVVHTESSQTECYLVNILNSSWLNFQHYCKTTSWYFWQVPSAILHLVEEIWTNNFLAYDTEQTTKLRCEMLTKNFDRTWFTLVKLGHSLNLCECYVVTILKTVSCLIQASYNTFRFLHSVATAKQYNDTIWWEFISHEQSTPITEAFTFHIRSNTFDTHVTVFVEYYASILLCSLNCSCRLFNKNDAIFHTTTVSMQAGNNYFVLLISEAGKFVNSALCTQSKQLHSYFLAFLSEFSIEKLTLVTAAIMTDAGCSPSVSLITNWPPKSQKIWLQTISNHITIVNLLT